MADIDTISKRLIQAYPADFVRFSLKRDDVEFVEVLDTELPTVEARRADSLILVRSHGEKVLVHTEFQTTDHTNPPMPRRMAGYIGRIIEHYGLPVWAHVIYLRPEAGRRDPGHYIQEHTSYQVTVRYQVIRLVELEGQSVFAASAWGLLPFAPLMQPPAGLTAEAWLQQCVQAAHALPMGRSDKADFLAGLTLLGGLAYEPQTIRTIISKENLMDLIRESSFAQYLTQQGIEQGIEQGERKRAVKDILDVLVLRFQPAAAETAANRLVAIDDLQQLEQLLSAAIQANSIDEFCERLEACG